MRAKDSDIFAEGSPLPGAAVPSNGVGVTEQSGSSPVGGVDPAILRDAQLIADAFFTVGLITGLALGIGCWPLLWSWIKPLLWRLFRFSVPFRFRVRSERRFRRWLLAQPWAREHRARLLVCRGAFRGWRFVTLTPGGRVDRKGGAA